MTCGGIWFANGKFGVTWKLIQAMVQKPRAQLSGKCFLKSKPIPSSESAQPVVQHVQHKVIEEKSEIELNVAIEDSDCDDEEDESQPNSQSFEPEPEPEPIVQNIVVNDTLPSEPTKKKKVVKKKAASEI